MKKNKKKEFYNVRVVFNDNDARTYAGCSDFFVHYTARYVCIAFQGSKIILPFDNVKEFTVDIFYK